MPASPEDLRRRTTDPSGSGVLSPADEEDIDGEFLGDGESAGRGVREVCYHNTIILWEHITVMK